MIDDVFVFDLVVHLHDMSDANLLAGVPWAAHVRDLSLRPGDGLWAVHGDRTACDARAALAGPPREYLRAFMDLHIPDDLREGYGYPQITLDDKRRILGRNAARLFGIEVRR